MSKVHIGALLVGLFLGSLLFQVHPAWGDFKPLNTILRNTPLRVGTECLLLTLPSAEAVAPVQDKRYRVKARSGMVCVSNGAPVANCIGKLSFDMGLPEEVVFGPGPGNSAPAIYAFTPDAAAALELCPLTEVP